jgi:glycosyltransferase involved in cell wall biosynthesis
MGMQKIERQFLSGVWQSTFDVTRPFVRYPQTGLSPAVYWHLPSSVEPIVLSVVIPTLDAHRGGFLINLFSQIEKQDLKGFELLVVRGDPRQGRAINLGAALAHGTYLLTLDDDTSLPDPTTFTKLVSVLDGHPEIGIAGGNNVIPDNADAFVRRVMEQIPRRSWKPVDVITDSDLAEHPCLMMRVEEFKMLGGENELIPRGLDPYLRQVFRESGFRVVVVPGVIYHHLPPATWVKLLKQFYRNGKQAAFVNRMYPQWVIETPDHHGSFTARISFGRRVTRYARTFIKSLLHRKEILFLTDLAYALGFVSGIMLSPKDSRDINKAHTV